MAAREVFAAKPASGTGGNVQPPSENRSPSSRLVSRPAQSSTRTGAAVSGIIPVVNSASTQAPAVRTGAAVSGIIPMANPTGSQAPAIRTPGTKNSAGSSPALKTSSSSEQSTDSLRSHQEDAPIFTPKSTQAGETSRPSRSPPRQETRDENGNLPVRESPPPTRKASPPQRDPPTPSQPTAKRSVTSDLPSRSVTSDLQSKLVTSDHPVTSDLRRRGSSDWRSRLSGRYEGRELPEIRRPLCDQCVRYGCRAILECEIAGVPRPDVSWTVNNRNIKVSRFFQMSYEDNKARLVIAEAFSEDEGEYTCTACNPSGTTQTSCHLTVEEPSSGSQSSHTDFEGPVSVRPQLLNLSSTNVSVLRGQPVEVNATFTGNPRPKVTWFKLKEEIQTDARVSVCSTEYTSTLVLATTVATDTGRYSVLVENCMGTDSAALSITVEDVPNAPMGQPHITAVTSTSVSLAWYGPAFDGGSQVTHYAVEVKDTGKGHWRELTSNCRSTSYEACGLGTDTEYVFRVRAGNKHGLGEPSTTSDPVMPRDHVHSDSESDDDTLPFEPRQVVISPDRQFEDHYTILNEVGKGKFGSVFRCKAKADDSEWAAKVIKVRPRERDAVLHEVDIMNQLAHPKLLLLRDAFSTTRSMTLVMEYIGGGELFERVISENFVLTERDCVHFMRQIVEGVNFMHSQSIMHLDLKPENILCISASSNQVKIIDFGLARYHRPGTSLKVMFGTPEFIAPEVVNYDEISPATDMWSLGVICYVLLSGLSPFLGDNDAETLANVTCGDFDFEDEAFDDISSTAKNFIESLLVKNKEKRLTMETCRRHRWLAQDERKIRCKRLNTDKLRCFMARRKWQKTGTAIRALGRLGLLQRALSSGSRSLRSESASSLDSKSPGPSPRSLDSDPSSPRPHSPPHLSTSLPKVNDDDEDEEGVDDRNSSARLDTVAATKGGNPSPRQGETTPGERLARREDPEPGETVLPLATPARAPSPLHCPVPNGDVTRTERGTAPPQNEAGGDRGARRRLRFEKRMLDCQAFKGDAVRFDVALSGPALPRVQWLLDGEAVEEDARHIRESDEERRHHSLIIRNVTDDDEGEYTCCARSDDGEVSCSADLVIVGSGAF